ncbi:MAG: response regulator [Planctomycetota bacterium]|nr:MAG: response regulator [Planctomycetota bacterium]
MSSKPGPLVLLVEDEPQVRRLLRTSLPPHGYRVLEAESGEQAVRLAGQYAPDLVLLDLGLPDMDGLEVTRRLRVWSRVPILVLSARGQENQKVEALDAGADDYLTKPFSFPELLARMRVALRHAVRSEDAGAESVFRNGPLLVDPERRRVLLDGEEVHLTPIEYKLLSVLVRHAGKVVTHRQLLEAVWGPRSGEQNQYLRVYMAHLRRKLEPDLSRSRLFATEAGVGYRMRLPEE